MRFKAIVEVCYRVPVEIETEAEAPAQVAIAAAMREIDYSDTVTASVVEITRTDG